jgi:hypothetical protein
LAKDKFQLPKNPDGARRKELKKRQENKKVVISKICDILLTDDSLTKLVDVMKESISGGKRKLKQLKQAIVSTMCDNIPEMSQESDDQQEVEDDDEYGVVAKINGHKGKKLSTLKLLVKWEGMRDCTWEPYKELQHIDDVKAYMKQYKLLGLLNVAPAAKGKNTGPSKKRQKKADEVELQTGIGPEIEPVPSSSSSEVR